MRKIHWKLSAKKQELMVKNNDLTTEAMTYIVLDLSKHEYSLEQKALIEDQMIECVLAVIHYSMRYGVTTRFIAYGECIVDEVVKDIAEFDKVYNVLFHMKFEEQTSFEKMIKRIELHEIQKREMILVTHQLTYELYEVVYELVLSGGMVQIIQVVLELREDHDAQIVREALEKCGVRVFCVDVNDVNLEVLSREGVTV